MMLKTDVFLDLGERPKIRGAREYSLNLLRRTIEEYINREAWYNIFGFPNDAGVRIILPLQKENQRLVGETLGLSSLLPVLQIIYENPESLILTIREPYPIDYQSNLILLGVSEVTQRVFEEYKAKGILSSHFMFNSSFIQVPQLKERGYYRPMIGPEDVGLFIKGPSPFVKDREVFVLAGCQTYGTAAATLILTSSPLVRDIAKVCGNGYFIGLVKVFMRSRDSELWAPLIQDLELLAVSRLKIPGGFYDNLPDK